MNDRNELMLYRVGEIYPSCTLEKTNVWSRNDWIPYVRDDSSICYNCGQKIPTKHKEVHNNLILVDNMDVGLFKIQAIGKTKAKLPVKMTLEWED